MAATPLRSKVHALRRPGCYAGAVARVEAVETHMSWVFLTEAHAYKMKKPVRHDGMDFTTLAKRHFYCDEELRLNRRLAPDVYLDVVPLTLERSGGLHVAGAGRAVEWLVKMRRLPAAQMLDALLARGAATPAMMQAVGRRLGAFHRAQPGVEDGAALLRASLARRIGQAGRELAEFVGNPAQVRALCEALRAALDHFAPAMDERGRAGRIVEGHGDLRPEHVFCGEPLAIIDCLEFSRELRTLDAADEAGFLALECERAGAPALGVALLQAWRASAGDDVAPPLVDFYVAVQALVRARLAAAHLRERRYRASPIWLRRTADYLALAQAHLGACGLSLPATP